MSIESPNFISANARFLSFAVVWYCFLPTQLLKQQPDLEVTLEEKPAARETGYIWLGFTRKSSFTTGGPDVIHYFPFLWIWIFPSHNLDLQPGNRDRGTCLQNWLLRWGDIKDVINNRDTTDTTSVSHRYYRQHVFHWDITYTINVSPMYHKTPKVFTRY